MQIEFQTNVGRKRKSNQDTVGVFKNQAGIVIGIVADGMGGHQAGGTASQLLVTGLGTSWEQTALENQEDVVKWVASEIQIQNDRIYEEGSTSPDKTGMGTTIVVAVILEEDLLIAHVGDSRGYIIRDNSIKQLTSDHSLVNELVKTGEITADMAGKHPKKNVLLRSIGIQGEVEVDLSIVTIKKNDYVLLCSDGLSNMLSDVEIKKIITSTGSLDRKVLQLINEANEAGGSDNITALLVDFKSEEQGGDV